MVDVTGIEPVTPACKSAWLRRSYLESVTYIRCQYRYSVRFGLFWSNLGTICVRIHGFTCVLVKVFPVDAARRRIRLPRRWPLAIALPSSMSRVRDGQGEVEG